MSKIPPDKTQELKIPRRHRANRGFFAVLALCLVAVGGVAASTFSDTLKPSTDGTTVTTTMTSATVCTTEIPAAAPTGVQTTTASSTATTVTPSTAPTEATPLVALPLNGSILTPYSEQPLFNETMKDYRAHLALDFDGEEEQAVRAVAAGTLTAVEDDPLWGPCLTLDHGAGVRSVYRGVRTSATIGAHFEAGHELGKLAAAVPCETHHGPHLHLELYHDEQAIDPAALLGELLPSENE